MGLTLAPKLHSDSDPTLTQVADDWLASIRGTVRPQTWQHYEKHLRRYWRPLLGDVPLTQLTRRRIRETMSELLVRLAPQTVAVAHSILRMVLSFAVDDELLEQNVAIGLARRLHRPIKRRTTCDLQQLNLFLQTAATVAPREYPIFVALASSGLGSAKCSGSAPKTSSARSRSCTSAARSIRAASRASRRPGSRAPASAPQPRGGDHSPDHSGWGKWLALSGPRSQEADRRDDRGQADDADRHACRLAADDTPELPPLLRRRHEDPRRARRVGLDAARARERAGDGGLLPRRLGAAAHSRSRPGAPVGPCYAARRNAGLCTPRAWKIRRFGTGEQGDTAAEDAFRFPTAAAAVAPAKSGT